MPQTARNMERYVPPRRARSSEHAVKKAVSIKMTDEQKNFIDHVANLIGENRSEFMITSAHDRAVDLLLDARVFLLDEVHWNAFTAALDDPSPPNAAMIELLNEPAPWDKPSTR